MRQPCFTLLHFVILALLTMGFQCDKDYPAPVARYEFVEKWTLYPYKKIYKVNDTIWLQFQTPDKKLFDRFTNTRVAVDTTFLQMTAHYTKHYVPSTTDEFYGKIVAENVQDTSFRSQYLRYNTFQFRTACTSSAFSFRIGFIAQKPGIYTLQAGGSIEPCPGRATWDYMTLKFTFDLADCNKDIFLTIPAQTRGNGNYEAMIDRKEMFAFRVQ